MATSLCTGRILSSPSIIQDGIINEWKKLNMDSTNHSNDWLKNNSQINSQSGFFGRNGHMLDLILLCLVLLIIIIAFLIPLD